MLKKPRPLDAIETQAFGWYTCINPGNITLFLGEYRTRETYNPG
jgi:hypothetical protein